MRGALWCVLASLVLVSGGVRAGQAAAADAEEIAQIKQTIADLQKRLQALEEKQTKEAAVKTAGPAIQFSGYVQGEYRRNTGEGANVSEADVRRARFKVDAQVLPNAAVTLQAEMNRNIELRDAYVDLGFRSVKLRAGQFKVPLSFQILESSSVRVTPERALINLRTVPGERDRGLLFDVPIHAAAKSPPVLQVGVFNGRGISQSENNTDKDILAALHFPSKPWSGRVAYLYGKYENPAPPAGSGTEVTKRRWSADVQYDRAPWNVQLQYGAGKGDFPAAGGTVSATDIRGGYVLVTYQPKARPFTYVARYQFYDPDTDTSGNTIDGPLFGIVYDPNKVIRYVLAWERLDNEAVGGDRDLITLRTQVKY